jgi:hypothetical protein
VIQVLIADALVAQITADMQTAIEEDDPTRANLVRKGRLQEDPEVQAVSVLVHLNDPDDPSQWADVVAEDLSEYPYSIFWRRRLTVAVKAQYTRRYGADRSSVTGRFSTIVSRLRHAILHTDVGGLTDGFGEGVVLAANPIKKQWVEEGGGPPDQFFWDGAFYLEYITQQLVT